jgi:hypothetical protein
MRFTSALSIFVMTRFVGISSSGLVLPIHRVAL